MRRRKVLSDNIQGVSRGAVTRLARRAGVKRINGLTYEETRSNLKVFLTQVIGRAVTYTEHARRKTVNAIDVIHALRGIGRPIYGMDQLPMRRARAPRLHGRGHELIKTTTFPENQTWAANTRWQGLKVHAMTVGHGLTVKPSTIPAAGRGLFADAVFKPGDFITRYEGKPAEGSGSRTQNHGRDRVDWKRDKDGLITKQRAAKERANDWFASSHFRSLKQGSDMVVDGITEPVQGKGGGPMINDRRLGRAGANADFVPIGNAVYMVAIKNINPGQEIFADYGSKYWRDFDKATV
jgi:histone H4